MTITGCGQRPAAAPTGERPTIVSLNPCTDAILAEVADPAQVLALSHYSHDPRATSMPLAQARRFRATGGTVEEVLALDPDVVVAGSFLPPATAQAFARLGVRVETFGIVSDLGENAARPRWPGIRSAARRCWRGSTGRWPRRGTTGCACRHCCGSRGGSCRARRR